METRAQVNFNFCDHSSDQIAFSSDDSDEDESQIDTQKLQASIFSGYPGATQIQDDSLDPLFYSGLSKINNLLVAARSGATTCLICLEKVRKTDPIWDCKQGCFTVLHLVCIQSWSRQSLGSSNVCFWHCPKCRTDYPQAEVPREYRCFCGKQADPAQDPWITPHTCGERCERKLQGNCGHTCVLLCHPGPCPPCPKLVHLKCYCGSKQELRRCGQHSFSCRNTCSKLLACNRHFCEEICHEGQCPPCGKVGIHSCRCGHKNEVRPCSTADFQCDRVCNNPLNCKKHWCDQRCHSGKCGDCELQGRRTCPCGKEEYKQISCDVKVPTCGSTCEKLLHCGFHRCPERCHWGPCVGTCRVLMKKSCRCGGLTKEVPCSQDLTCERKCQSTRTCGRHACRRRCCDGDCPQCPEICGRKLRCGNHKCPSPCHRGLCAPCPLTVKISCACGASTITVPCGADKDIRPPKCYKRCSTPQPCVHGDQCKPHRCHYGACPPCKLICRTELPCGHQCNSKCHGSQPAPKPEFALKAQKKKLSQVVPFSNIGSPCPPCSEMIVQQCVGKHPGGERTVRCSSSPFFPCEKSCGNSLSCGNHVCRRSCHIVGDCGKCELKCQRERKCQHKCDGDCHSDQCPPCKTLIRKSCHCGSLLKSFECCYFNNLTKEQQVKELSCGGPCHRKMEHCSHLCSEICHPDSCPQSCLKKVTVRCLCQRIKKEWLCCDVRKKREVMSVQSRATTALVGLIECDMECIKSKQEESSLLHQRKLSDANSSKDELVVKKRRKRRPLNGDVGDDGVIAIVKRVIMIAAKGVLAIVAIIVIYYGMIGLQRLSDWMNEIDEQRHRYG